MHVATDVTDATPMHVAPDVTEAPDPVHVQERFRRLPEALLLTAGYYASRLPTLKELIRQLD